MKLEMELAEAKETQKSLTAKTSFLVSDIRKVGILRFQLSPCRPARPRPRPPQSPRSSRWPGSMSLSSTRSNTKGEWDLTRKPSRPQEPRGGGRPAQRTRAQLRRQGGARDAAEHHQAQEGRHCQEKQQQIPMIKVLCFKYLSALYSLK